MWRAFPSDPARIHSLILLSKYRVKFEMVRMCRCKWRDDGGGFCIVYLASFPIVSRCFLFSRYTQVFHQWPQLQLFLLRAQFKTHHNIKSHLRPNKHQSQNHCFWVDYVDFKQELRYLDERNINGSDGYLETRRVSRIWIKYLCNRLWFP